ncbi:calmodulin-related [Lithospermum erythrorhizon]|uniref:Calmodulin-related n=1 Tax=Lithospermum erythrorhizon TaxID=34254 RepID=A0AAV3RXQ8_LITER
MSNSKPTMFLQDTSEVEKVFQRFDRNGDGRISADELKDVLKALGSTSSPEDISLMMQEIDIDKDGYINLKEFSSFIKPKESSDGGINELKEAFDMYDENHNGLISANELHQILNQIGQSCTVQDCEKMIKTVDADGDGCVSFDEFKVMMSNNNK